MCLSCQYLPPADELNLQLALSVRVCQGVDVAGKLPTTTFPL